SQIYVPKLKTDSVVISDIHAAYNATREAAAQSPLYLPMTRLAKIWNWRYGKPLSPLWTEQALREFQLPRHVQNGQSDCRSLLEKIVEELPAMFDFLADHRLLHDVPGGGISGGYSINSLDRVFSLFAISGDAANA